MPSLSINDIQMHYEHHLCDDSSHPPLLLLSGMASDCTSWQPVVAELSKHYELLIPDNRCSGRTLPNPVSTSRDRMLHDILILLDKLKIDKVNVLGHSMGGMLGWALAAQAPTRVNRLISASAQSSINPARVALFNSLSALRTTHNEAHWFKLLYQFLFSPSFFQHPVAVDQAVNASLSYPHKQSHTAFSAQAAALETFKTPVNPGAILCPVSLLTGANDLLMTPALLEAFCTTHNYPFTIIPDAAHALHWEQTQTFVQYVIDELGTAL